jgi:hypothetical protein
VINEALPLLDLGLICNRTEKSGKKNLRIYPLAQAKGPPGTKFIIASGVAFVDSEGKPLDGGKTYKIHPPPNVPAKDFWSFVVYDNQTRSMLQTDQQFPSIGSQKKELVANPDSSVDVLEAGRVRAGEVNNPPILTTQRPEGP